MFHHASPCPSFAVGPVIGAYVIVHVASGRFYVGATTNLYARKHQHTSSLSLGKHYCKPLQDLFDQDDCLTMHCFPTDDYDEALKYEQDLVLKHAKSGKLLNVSLDTRRPFKGLHHTDEVRRNQSIRASSLRHSPEHKAYMSKLMSGRYVSPATREKISALKTGVSRPSHVVDLLHEHNDKKAKYVIIAGITYPSAAAAARAFGIDAKTVHNRIASTSGRFDDWCYALKTE